MQKILAIDATFGSDYDKVKKIHDAVCGTVTYDDAMASGGGVGNAYNAMVDGSSVCQGYAMAFKMACDVYGINCICASGWGVTGESGEGEPHMWNLVQLDGKWYGLDATWDDQSELVYDFFLVGSSTLPSIGFPQYVFADSHQTDTATFSVPTMNTTAYARPNYLDKVEINKSCTISDKLSINFYYTLGDNGTAYGTYDNVKLVVERKEYATDASDDYEIKKYEILPTEDTSKGYSRYRFAFENFLAYMIGDEVSAVLYAEKDGVTYQTVPEIYSISQYAYNMLGKSDTSDSLKKLLVDLLNYGSMAQIYFNYRPDTLANAGLTTAQQGLGTQTAPAITGSKGSVSMTGTPTARFISNSAVLTNSIELKYYMGFDNTVDLSKVKLVLEYESVETGKQTIEISGSDFVYDENLERYSAKLTSLAIYDVGQVVTATLYEGDTQISDAQTYSLEIYAKNQIGKNPDFDEYVDLLNAMICFSRSAKDYLSSL